VTKTAAADPQPDQTAIERQYVPGDGWEAKVPRIAAWVCFVIAALSALTAIFPFSRAPLSGLRTVGDLLFVAAPPNLAWAVLLAILASALSKRKRAAWVLLLGLEIIESVLLVFAWVVFPGTSYPAITSALFFDVFVIAVLVLSRREFFAVSQKGNGWRALVTFVVGFVLSLGIGVVVIAVFGDPQLQLQKLGVIVSEFLGVFGQDPSLKQGGQTSFFATEAITGLIALLGSATFIATAYVLFRPRRTSQMLSGQDEVDLRLLLAEEGERDSLGYFATRRDKSVDWAPSGTAAVTSRVVFGVSLASADPIGDPQDWPAAIEAWLEDARKHAWAPAVMGASELGAQAYSRAGLGAVELGDEAIISFGDYHLEGRHMRVVRQAVNRIERAGYTARVRRHAEIPGEEMAEVIADADRWRDTDNERGFTMALGRLGDPLDGRCVLVEAFDPEGNREALLSFSPWGDKGLSLDLMRRSRDSANGVMEFMVTSLVAAGAQIGANKLSLNFAVMRAIFADGERIGAGPVLRLTRALLLFASRWVQLESLYRSNEKYSPNWVPRYTMFETVGDLPRVGIATGIAEGFVSVPSPRSWFRNSGNARSPLKAACDASPVALYEVQEARLADIAAKVAGEIAGDPLDGLPEQEKVRRQKLANLRARGIDPYASSFQRTTTIAKVREEFADLEPDARTGKTVSVAGRVMLNRVTGKLCFAELRDWTAEIQIMVSLAVVGEDSLNSWKHDLDLGDIVGVTGEVVTSRRGELSVLADDFKITSKCLVPLPDKHKGLNDPEARVRQRYLDLIVNQDSRDMLAMRSKMVRAIREQLWNREYLEVETPMMQRVHGGANARPFVTHINAYDMQLYMRIAPELFLKRLLVGGVERVFELNRNFRNEGADSTHNPEFTSMEMYDAYGDYDTMRVLTRELILAAAVAVHGRPIVKRPIAGAYDGSEGYEEVDISGDWPVITLHEGISAALGEEVTVDTDLLTLRRLADQAGIAHDQKWGSGQLTLELYEHLCEARTTTPVFWTDFPTDVSPLTRKKPSEPRLAERWDLVAWGAEIGTAYTELIDPIDQRERLTAQSRLAAAGDTEAMEIDEDFLRALEYGMPPTGGQGMGIDRLLMLLTGRNIRDSVLFPLTRPDQQ
jgi:lysyl-tRNA synthetase class 2